MALGLKMEGVYHYAAELRLNYFIGASLSEPHTSRNGLCLYVCMFDRLIINVQFSF